MIQIVYHRIMDCIKTNMYAIFSDFLRRKHCNIKILMTGVEIKVWDDKITHI